MLHMATDLLQAAQGGLAPLQDPRLHRIGAAPIAQPADPHPLGIAGLQRRDLVMAHPMRLPRIGARDHIEQDGDILRAAPHRAQCGKLVQEGVADGLRGHQPPAWPETVDIVPGRRVAQRAHHVRPVGQRQHAGRQRHRRAAGRPAAGARRIVWVHRGAIDRVEGMRAQAEFRHIGLADEDRPRRAHPRRDQLVGLGHEIGQQGRTLGRRDARDIGQILDRDRQPVQRPAPGFGIGRPRRRHQRVGVLQRDDGVDL